MDFNHHHLVKRCFLIELISSSSDERDAIQKKTFTKWVNKHLKKVTIDFYMIMLEWKTKTFLENSDAILQNHVISNAS